MSLRTLLFGRDRRVVYVPVSDPTTPPPAAAYLEPLEFPGHGLPTPPETVDGDELLRNLKLSVAETIFGRIARSDPYQSVTAGACRFCGRDRGVDHKLGCIYIHAISYRGGTR